MKTKLFLFALISLFIFAACGKEDAPKPKPTPDSNVPNPDPDPNPTLDTYYISFTTKKDSKETIILIIDAAKEDQKGIWIDLNGNDIKDEGEAIVTFKKDREYKIDSQEIKVYGKITKFDCGYNQLNNLDVSNNPILKELRCNTNNLKNLNLTNNIALNVLYCGKNYLNGIDISKNVNLTSFNCDLNELTELDVSNNPLLENISILSINFYGEAMEKLVKDIPNRTGDSEGEFFVFDSNNSENNVITKNQVKILKEEKNWKVLDIQGGEYIGS